MITKTNPSRQRVAEFPTFGPLDGERMSLLQLGGVVGGARCRVGLRSNMSVRWSGCLSSAALEVGLETGSLANSCTGKLNSSSFEAWVDS